MGQRLSNRIQIKLATSLLVAGAFAITGALPAAAQSNGVTGLGQTTQSVNPISGPLKPINITQVLTNLVTGSATVDGVIAMVGTNHFVVMRYNNNYTLVFLQPGTNLPVTLYPGGHIVATVMPGQANAFVLQKINQYDGIDPTQPGASTVQPPIKPSIIPQLPVIDTPIPIPGL